MARSPKLAPRVADRSLQDVLQRMLDDLADLNKTSGMFSTRTVRMRSGESIDIKTGENLTGAFPVRQANSIDWHSVEVLPDGGLKILAEFDGGDQDVTWVVVRK